MSVHNLEKWFQIMPHVRAMLPTMKKYIKTLTLPIKVEKGFYNKLIWLMMAYHW